jgi:hypothetical protein
VAVRLKYPYKSGQTVSMNWFAVTGTDRQGESLTGGRRNDGFGSEFAVLWSVGEIVCFGRNVTEMLTY